MVKMVEVNGLVPLPPLIVLTGFRATGKSAVGNCLAALTGYRFIDTDQEISNRLGCSIAESVNRHGWQPFRNEERIVLLEIIDCHQAVIATGGGAILHRETWQQLQAKAYIIWLRATVSTTMTRLQQDSTTGEQRPDLPGCRSGSDRTEATAALLTERAPLYRAGSERIIDTDRSSPEELAVLISAPFLNLENSRSV